MVHAALWGGVARLCSAFPTFSGTLRETLSARRIVREVQRWIFICLCREVGCGEIGGSEIGCGRERRASRYGIPPLAFVRTNVLQNE